MPSRPKHVLTTAALVARLGPRAFERRVWGADADGARVLRHHGWRWACSCRAFPRSGRDEYVWVPCLAHEPEVKGP